MERKSSAAQLIAKKSVLLTVAIRLSGKPKTTETAASQVFFFYLTEVEVSLAVFVRIDVVLNPTEGPGCSLLPD